MCFMDNISHTETFNIDGVQISLGITRKGGLWRSEVVEGYTGAGNSSGGVYSCLADYVQHQKTQHTYSFRFFDCKNKQHQAHA